MGAPSAKTPIQIGRYAIHGVMSQGGMATVHYGRLMGPVGFSRAVAIKRLHPQFATDPEFIAMFVDEARLVSRIRHPNVVPTLDVVSENGELFMVMDYVQGESLARLLMAMRTRKELILPSVAAGIIAGVLRGLHAAHEATHSTHGPLGIVHRDISPQNVMVGIDGVSRVLDFGVAKAFHRVQITRENQLKGKVPYMSPEQLQGKEVNRQTDIFAAAIVLWESLTTRRLFAADRETQVMKKILEAKIIPPSIFLAELHAGLDRRALRAIQKLDDVVLHGLARDPKERFATAREMLAALEKSTDIAPPSVIGEWVERVAHEALAERAARMAEIEPDAGPPMIVRDVIHAIRSIPPERPADSFRPTVSAVSVAKPGRPRHAAPSRLPTYAIALMAIVLATLVGALIVLATFLVLRL
ncbi:MAG: serine/threonine-protein kinase [Polyangiaceae bacterium]